MGSPTIIPPEAATKKDGRNVEELLTNGISVIASINLQYIEEYREQVGAITGKTVTGTVPKDFLKFAEEIEVVDAPPEMCLERADAPPNGGNAPTGSTMDRQQGLSQLREMALLLAADVVDYQLEGYLHRHGIEQLWGAHERILVWVTPQADATPMIASGQRNANRFQGELFVASVAEPDLSSAEQKILNANLARAKEAGAHVELLDGESRVDAVMSFAKSRGITQIFLGRARRKSPWERILGSDLDRLIQAAEEIDIRIFPQ